MVIDSLKMIEKFHFQFFAICAGRGNKVEGFYSDCARKLFENQLPDLNTVKQKLEKKFKEEAPKFGEFLDNFTSITYEKSKKSKLLIHYIFDRYNNYNMEGVNVADLFKLKSSELKRAYCNIDHIQPYNNSDLEKEMQDNIGNLIVVNHQDNSSWNDIPPQEKFIKIQNSLQKNEQLRYLNDYIKFAMPDECSDNEFKWGADEIKKNAERIAKKIYDEITAF